MKKQTKMCVYCLKRRAVSWVGHVVEQNTGIRIIAGWCEVHRYAPDGFVGHFKRKMGMESYQ
jgi:hypothetical protein